MIFAPVRKYGSSGRDVWKRKQEQFDQAHRSSIRQAGSPIDVQRCYNLGKRRIILPWRTKQLRNAMTAPEDDCRPATDTAHGIEAGAPRCCGRFIRTPRSAHAQGAPCTPKRRAHSARRDCVPSWAPAFDFGDGLAASIDYCIDIIKRLRHTAIWNDRPGRVCARAEPDARQSLTRRDVVDRLSDRCCCNRRREAGTQPYCVGGPGGCSTPRPCNSAHVRPPQKRRPLPRSRLASAR